MIDFVSLSLAIVFFALLTSTLYITRMYDLYRAKSVKIDDEHIIVSFLFGRNKEIPIKEISKLLIYSQTQGPYGGLRRFKELYFYTDSGEIINSGIVSDYVLTSKSNKEFMKEVLPDTENNRFFQKVIDYLKKRKVKIENTHLTKFRQDYIN